MLVIGAKGLAKEVLEVLVTSYKYDDISFYDDVSDDMPDFLFNKFRVIKNIKDAEIYFKKIDNKFCLGVGNPRIREILSEKFENLGGLLSSVISNKSQIGSYDNSFQAGVSIMPGAVLTNSIHVKKGTLINQLTSIGHDVTIGSFVEICPNVSISGRCSVGNNSFIGTGAIILPDVKVGDNVTIGAGAVVNMDIPDNAVAVGIPAKVIKIKDNE